MCFSLFPFKEGLVLYKYSVKFYSIVLFHKLLYYKTMLSGQSHFRPHKNENWKMDTINQSIRNYNCIHSLFIFVSCFVNIFYYFYESAQIIGYDVSVSACACIYPSHLNGCLILWKYIRKFIELYSFKMFSIEE